MRSSERQWAAFVGAWVALEGHALWHRHKHEDYFTFSKWTRHLVGIEPRHNRRYVTTPLFAGLLVWFFGHIVWKWKP